MPGRCCYAACSQAITRLLVLLCVACSFVIDQINGIHVNIGGHDFGLPSIPHIPHLWQGGFVPPGGMAWTGDRPGGGLTQYSELVFGGQSGATVFSHQQSMAMAGQAGGMVVQSGPQQIIIQVIMDGEVIAERTAPAAAAIIVDNLLNYGPVQGVA